ncbi:unnamed protein product [Spirodela intermedia]|uniref:DUF7731 domain-containing protein n=1 Tax=Spirodela intermedia TaxID=51605 RepID=A0A7I8L881_SPIIN|nr:unnamed protein product [Spirodela intermedia]
MAPSTALLSLRRCLILALLCASAPPKDRPEEIIFRALACFTDHYIDGRCTENQRLKAQGFLNISREETDAFCAGPCLDETYQVLNCVDDVLDGYRFYNGAAVADVKAAIRRGCSNGRRRGDFSVEEIMNGDHAGYYGQGSRLAASSTATLMMASSWLLLL